MVELREGNLVMDRSAGIKLIVAVASLALLLVGNVLTVGWWASSLSQLQAQHERRISKVENTTESMTTRVTRVEVQIEPLVRLWEKYLRDVQRGGLDLPQAVPPPPG